MNEEIGKGRKRKGVDAMGQRTREELVRDGKESGETIQS
jgi:hypothetical protein